MALKDLLSADVIKVPLVSNEKSAVIEELVSVAHGMDRFDNPQEIIDAVMAREELCSTGLDRGIAVPHAKTMAVKQLTVVLGIQPKGVDFDALDGEPSKLFFLILTPPEQALAHVETLSDIAKVTQSSDFIYSLFKAENSEEIYSLFLDS